MSSLRTWMAIGTGVGIEMAADYLRVVVSRVRPGGIDVLGVHTIERHRERPAAEWGAEYIAFLKRHGVRHLAAAVLLPRSEMVVRVVSLPGVADRDLDAALRLQIDSLHPYPETEAAWSWARLPETNAVLVGIARQSFVDRQVEIFAEAGIKISAFTFSAAAVYSALRLYGSRPIGEGFVALLETPSGVEAYGESPGKPVYSANYEQSWERAAVLASSELRLPENSIPRELAAVLPSPRQAPEVGGYTLAYLASLSAACPRLGLPANLLPSAQRSTSSRLIYVPTAVLGGLLVIGLVALGVFHRYEDQKYLTALQSEIASLEPRVKRLSQLDQRMEQASARLRLLDTFAGRTKSDLDALREATRVIAPPAWLHTLELSRTSLVVGGEADQATGLLKALDGSKQFENSEFLVPLSRVGPVEVFRIRSVREGGAR